MPNSDEPVDARYVLSLYFNGTIGKLDETDVSWKRCRKHANETSYRSFLTWETNLEECDTRFFLKVWRQIHYYKLQGYVTMYEMTLFDLDSSDELVYISSIENEDLDYFGITDRELFCQSRE